MDLLMSDDEFMNAVSTTIDALSFAQTHTADLNFRAHARGHAERISTAQREQSFRINSRFGSQAPSPEFIGSQLLAEYRGEAASVQLSRDSANHSNAAMSNGPNASVGNAISRMSENQCRIFKKELKQRIHEWERAVKESKHQDEVLDEQKTPLRVIYELYKTCKNAVLMNETNGRKSETTENLENNNVTYHNDTEKSSEKALNKINPADTVARSTRLGGVVVGTHIYTDNKVAGNRNESEVKISHPFPIAQDNTLETHGTVSTINVTPSNNSVDNRASARLEGKESNNNNNNLNSKRTDANIRSVSQAVSVNDEVATTHVEENEGSANAFAKSVEEDIVRMLPHVKLGVTKANLMTDNDLIEEKRRIKQVLYKFETEFEKLTGQHPVREYRRGLKREYHRYSELKNELAKRSGTVVSSNPNNSTSRARSTQELERAHEQIP